MRVSVALVLALCALTLAGCGDADTVSVLAKGGFVVRPAALGDPSCGGAHGVRLPWLGESDAAVVGTMPDGSMLLVGKTAKRAAVLYSLTPTCALDTAFGRDGTAKAVIPARLAQPLAKWAGGSKYSLSIGGFARRNGGGTILVGQYGDHGVVGEITRQGRLDQAFGDGGWRVLPFRGFLGGAVQEKSGRIVVAGGMGAGCCVVNWAAALSSDGTPDRTFGKHGQTPLPTGEDAGVASLALEPNGDILALVGWGNSGCWGVTPAMLTSTGQPVPRFAARWRRFYHRLGVHAFVGDVYVKGSGFVLVGTGQKPCAGMPSLASAHSAHGILARFRTDGTQAGPAVSFRSRMYGEVTGFDAGRGTLVVEAPYFDPTRIRVVAVRSDGAVDRDFAGGRALIRTPWRGRDADFETSFSAISVGSRQLVLLASYGVGSHRLQLIRLRF